MGSPVVWGTSLPALAHVGISTIRRRRAAEAAIVVTGAFAVLYLAWLPVITQRSFTFLFYLLPGSFMCLALATWRRLWPDHLRDERLWRSSGRSHRVLRFLLPSADGGAPFRSRRWKRGSGSATAVHLLGASHRTAGAGAEVRVSTAIREIVSHLRQNGRRYRDQAERWCAGRRPGRDGTSVC